MRKASGILTRRRKWPGGKQSPKKLSKAERERRALDLRKQGFFYHEIGSQLGVSEASAYQDVKRALRAIIDERNEHGDELLQIEIQRLDAALNAIWPKVEKGDESAVDRLIKILERKSKFLGLDAPEKREMLGNKDKPLQYEHSLDPSNLSDDTLSELISAKRDDGSSQSET